MDESSDGVALVYILFLLQSRHVLVPDDTRLRSGPLGTVADNASSLLRAPSLFVNDLKLWCSDSLYYRVPDGWDDARRQEVPILHLWLARDTMHVQVLQRERTAIFILGHAGAH